MLILLKQITVSVRFARNKAPAPPTSSPHTTPPPPCFLFSPRLSIHAAKSLTSWNKWETHQENCLHFNPNMSCRTSYITLRSYTATTSRVWARIWSLGDNLFPWLKFWETFLFLRGTEICTPLCWCKGVCLLRFPTKIAEHRLLFMAQPCVISWFFRFLWS